MLLGISLDHKRILDRRDCAMYVDYVDNDGGTRWVTPAFWDDLSMWTPSRAPELVGSMARCGLFTLPGLATAEQIWTDVQITDDTRFNEVAALTETMLLDCQEAGLAAPDATAADGRSIVEQWSFLMYALSARSHTVSDSVINDQGRRGEVNLTF